MQSAAQHRSVSLGILEFILGQKDLIPVCQFTQVLYDSAFCLCPVAAAQIGHVLLVSADLVH